MLLKFIPRGTGKGAGGVEYIIRKDDYITKKLRSPAPEVLRNGDPAMTIKLIEDLDFKHKYTSGVISFAVEDAPTPFQQSELMTDFEKHAFAGLDSDAYNILWVRHTHTGDNRVELHFIVPMVELKTGKSLNIAPPGWQGYFKPWQTSWNLKRGWARPDDIERARVSSPGHQAYANKQRQLEGKPLLDSPRTRVTQLIEQKIESGLVRNRADIVQTLVANNYKILRTTSRSVTIENPDWQGKENSSRARIRLKSGVFYADWTVERQAQAKERDRSLLLKRLKDKSQKQTKEKFNYRAEKNRERYYSSTSYAAESKAVVTEYQDLQEFMEARLVTAAIAPTSNYPSNSAVLKQELEEFKQSLNLVEYAVSLGYRVTEANQADSNISYLTHPDGEQISISTKPNDRDRYTVVGSEQDQFTIIDLVQKRQNADLTEALCILQNYYEQQKNKAISVANSAPPQLQNECNADLPDSNHSEMTVAEPASNPLSQDDKEQEELKFQRQGKETLEEVRVPTESVISPDEPKPILDNSKVTAAKEAVSFQPERKQPKPRQAELPDSTQRALQSRLDTLNNRIELDRQLAEFSVVKSNSYLKSLGIETATLLDARFLKTIKIDGNGTLIFRHQNQEKTTGYQSIAKNVNRFSKDGTKSLWQSNFTEYDRHLIIVESPIDAIAHYQLHRQAQTRYIAFGDRPNPQQLEFAYDMVRSFIRQRGAVTVATNNDSVGEQIFESISSKFSLDLVGRAKPKKQTWIGDVLEKQKQKLSQENKDSQNELPNRFDKYLIGYIKTSQQSSSKKQNLLEGNGNSQEGNG